MRSIHSNEMYIASKQTQRTNNSVNVYSELLWKFKFILYIIRSLETVSVVKFKEKSADGLCIDVLSVSISTTNI